MAVDIEDPRWIWLPIEDAEQAYDGDRVFMDKWWICTHKGLAFWSANRKRSFAHPQCNNNEVVATTIRNKLYPWAEVRKYHKVYVPSR